MPVIKYFLPLQTIGCLLQLLSYDVVSGKKPWTKCKQRSMAVFQTNFIYKNRRWTGFGLPQAVICWPLGVMISDVLLSLIRIPGGKEGKACIPCTRSLWFQGFRIVPNPSPSSTHLTLCITTSTLQLIFGSLLKCKFPKLGIFYAHKQLLHPRISVFSIPFEGE